MIFQSDGKTAKLFLAELIIDFAEVIGDTVFESEIWNFFMLLVMSGNQDRMGALEPLHRVTEKFPVSDLYVTVIHHARTGDYHVFHFIGHGGMDARTGEMRDVAQFAQHPPVTAEPALFTPALGNSEGEIGLNRVTRNELAGFKDHVDLAMDLEQLIHIHTPHLEDKYQGTRMILDMLKNDGRINRERVLIDHVEEHTVRHVLEEGFWAGMTLYPVSKCTPARAADIGFMPP